MGDEDYHGPGPRRPEPPLTDAELRELRELLLADQRVKWFWAMSRRVAVWTAAAFGALAVTWDALVRAVRHLSGL
jgi:hypothetical protein